MRLLLLLATLCLLLASGYLVSIYAGAPYAAVARLGHVPYYEYAPDGAYYLHLALTPARYEALRAGLWALLGGSALAAVALLSRAAARRELRLLAEETSRAGRSLGRTVRRLSSTERAGAAALLLALLAAQVVWLVLDPLSPD